MYYTLPCIATLVFPEPEQWKKSWETVYRSLMPHRRSIIEDEQRVKSVSELPPSPLPHGVPGPWTTQVANEIAWEFWVSPESFPSQLLLGICEKCWPYIMKTRRAYHHFLPAKKDTRRGSPFPSHHVAGCLTSIAPSPCRRFSGLTIPTSTLPSRFCRMRS